MSTITTKESVIQFVDTVNRNYEKCHKSYEDNFWATKMALANNSTEELGRTKAELDKFLGDKQLLEQTEAILANTALVGQLEEKYVKALQCFAKTCRCYIMPSEADAAFKSEIDTLEGNLAQGRNGMNLGYVDPDSKEFVKASSVKLRTLMRTSDNPAVRKACFEGMGLIGPYVVEQFCQIILKRNVLARKLGYVDFYDMKVTQAEGFNKKELFEILDDLEIKTRPLMEKARERLAAEKGADALLPYNMSYMMAGDVTKLKDPYFPFHTAVDAWSRSFAALGINYKNAVMRLDLCDRDKKYSNGFCHWPQPAWRCPSTGAWIPSQVNFTSLANPNQIGSGLTALTTLMHEAGHAAHFANVDQPSPLFSQERAPTSVAYAENQSMFLDSLVGDAAWVSRYALSKEGVVIPWNIVEQDIKCTHPYQVFALRAMLAVPYFEKALYELPEVDVTPEKVLALANQVEVHIQGGLSPRPLMTVPHILADESSAYYHGYVLAEMSVHQTRRHFLRRYGRIVDNDQVGKDLTEVYWTPGNSVPFRTLVKTLTGEPLNADAWVEELGQDMEKLLQEEKKEYEEGVKQGAKYKKGDVVDIGMRVLLVHGDEVVADSQNAGGLATACDVYAKWLEKLPA